jgi:hypothetical protein
MVRRCLYCGCIPEQPLLFSMATQRIFNYIWNHPQVTGKVLNEQFGSLQSNSVHVHISRIRTTLRGTKYRLVSVGLPRQPGTRGIGTKAYEIVTIEQPTIEGVHDHL